MKIFKSFVLSMCIFCFQALMAKSPPPMPMGEAGTQMKEKAKEAREKGKKQRKKMHRGMKKAKKSCEGKKAGDRCQFKGKKGKNISGTCFSPKAKKKKLFCKPEGMTRENYKKKMEKRRENKEKRKEKRTERRKTRKESKED